MKIKGDLDNDIRGSMTWPVSIEHSKKDRSYFEERPAAIPQ